MCRRRVFLTLAFLSLLAGLTAPVTAQEATPATEVGGVTILGPDESYAGASHGEWDARQWQWAVSFPQEISPGFDETSERCGYGQFGPVFFLPGSFTPEPKTVTCVVSEGTAILVGLGGAECSSVEPPPFFGRDEAELRACAVAATDAITEVTATINGEAVPDVMSYRSTSPLFSLTFPEGNFFGVPEGVALAVSNGYSFIIAPPPPGEYELVTTTAFEGEPEAFTGTIRVIVEAPQVIEPEASPEATPVT